MATRASSDSMGSKLQPRFHASSLLSIGPHESVVMAAIRATPYAVDSMHSGRNTVNPVTSARN